MSDRAALLAAICANPDEDTPRLVFADWCDEHGDALAAPAAVRAWAAFIRDDIAASRRDEYDPARLRWELIEKPSREKEGWVGKVLPALPKDCAFFPDPLFRRGFPRTLNVKWPGSTTGLPRVHVGPFPFERVRFDACPGSYIADALAAAPWRDRIDSVAFVQRYGTVGLRRLLAVQGLNRLERLAFFNDAITPAEVRELIAAPLFRPLTSFAASRAPVGGAVVESLVREGMATELHELHLDNTRLPPDRLRDLLDSPAAVGFESLSLGGDGIGAPRKLEALCGAPPDNLRALNLSGDSLPQAGLEALAASPLAPRLRRLAFGRCNVNTDRTRVLAGGLFHSLRVLALNNNLVGNEGAEALASSPHLTGLLVLDLSYSQVGDEGIVAILESPLADALVLLDLTGSPASADMKELVKARMGDRVRL